MTKQYSPPFTITPAIASLLAETAEAIGRLSAQAESEQALRLRRINRIRTIHGSLAIEGNTLTEEQITAILDGKRVLAPPRDIQEVHNAVAAYDMLAAWRPDSDKDLLAAHGILMKGLLEDAGHYRRGGVGVMAGKEVIHMAPPAKQVQGLMQQLLDWVGQTDLHPLLASSVFHYEFEFIHPFADGNGRMGRLWQTLILSHWNPLLAYLPVESLVHDHQKAYYQALQDSTAQGDNAPFVAFMLAMIRDAAKTPVKTPVKTRVKTPEQIMQLLAAQPTLTLAEVAATIGKSVSAVERAAARLVKEGRLQYIGPQKGGHWEVRE